LPHTLNETAPVQSTATAKAARMSRLADSLGGELLTAEDYEAAADAAAAMRDSLPGLTDEQLIDVSYHICQIGRGLVTAALEEGDMPSIDALTLVWGQSIIAGEIAKGLS
jgi:hypothetical protein